jgi:hypothetical protein
LPHVTPDGTVWTTVTNNPPQQGFANADIWLIWSRDGGNTWEGPLPVVQGIAVPTYQNTTFREGIVNSFATGYQRSSQGYYPLYVTYEEGASFSHVYLTASYDGGRSWTAAIRVDDGVDDATPGEALQPNLDVAPNGTVSVAFYDRRLSCPTGAEAVAAGLQFDPNAPYGAADYCINAAIQRYRPNLAPIGQNVRLTSRTWDPQLNAPHPGCICSSRTFIGDYFGVNSGGGFTYTTSVSTFNYAGENPSYYQQQIVSKLATP